MNRDPLGKGPGSLDPLDLHSLPHHSNSVLTQLFNQTLHATICIEIQIELTEALVLFVAALGNWISHKSIPLGSRRTCYA